MSSRVVLLTLMGLTASASPLSLPLCFKYTTLLATCQALFFNFFEEGSSGRLLLSPPSSTVGQPLLYLNHTTLLEVCQEGNLLFSQSCGVAVRVDPHNALSSLDIFIVSQTERFVNTFFNFFGSASSIQGGRGSSPRLCHPWHCAYYLYSG